MRQFVLLAAISSLALTVTGCSLIGDFGSFGPEHDAAADIDATVEVDAGFDAGVFDAGPRFCDPACPASQDCVEGTCVERFCLPLCGVGETCFGDTCRCGEGAGCGLGERCVAGQCDCVTSEGTSVDVLFMIDNSNSMLALQAALAVQLQSIVRILATGDLNLDGSPEFPGAADLHLGVITSDMGVGGYVVPTCAAADYGDDGLLQTAGNASMAGCVAEYPLFLAYEPPADPDALAAQLACVASAGTMGCGFEQQLEAVLKAVTPSISPLRFVGDTRGHGDNANDGFLRRDSVFAAILLTDEEDCSVVDPGLFDPANIEYGDLNLRCYFHPEAQHPVSRYVDGLLDVRRDPRDVIFAAITGVPPDAIGAAYPPAYDAILAREDMQVRVDPGMPNRTVASCSTSTGVAFPPRRIVEVARDLDARGASGVLGSICQDDFTDPVREILRRLLRRLEESCAP